MIRISSIMTSSYDLGKEKGVGNAQKAENLDTSACSYIQPWQKHWNIPKEMSRLREEAAV